MRKACAQDVYSASTVPVLTHTPKINQQAMGIKARVLHNHVHTELVHRAPFTHSVFNLFTDAPSGLYTFFTGFISTTTMYLNNNIIRRAA